MGEITKKVQERRLKWYVHVMRREEHYVGRRAMVMKVQVRRKRARPKRSWLDKVKDDIKEKGCRLMMCTTVLHGGVCHRTSTPHKIGNKMKEKKKIISHYNHYSAVMFSIFRDMLLNCSDFVTWSYQVSTSI